MDNAEIRRRNLRLLVEQHGAAKVADKLGISPSQLSQNAGKNPSRSIGTSLARRIEKAFRKPLGWIDVLQDQRPRVVALRGGRRLPVLNYVQAGNPQEVLDDYVPGQGMDEIETDFPVGRYAFALEIRGNSMEPEFVEGDRVVIDPEIKPRAGDCIAAKVDGEVTFKKFRPRGIDTKSGEQQYELAPLNPDYATIVSTQAQIEVIGTMVEHRRYRRRR